MDVLSRDTHYSLFQSNMDPNRWLRIGGVSGALAIAFGAFGAHALRSRVSDERILKAFETGAHYHLVHSVAIALCSVVQHPHSNWAGSLFVAGNLLFRYD